MADPVIDELYRRRPPPQLTPDMAVWDEASGDIRNDAPQGLSDDELLKQYTPPAAPPAAPAAPPPAELSDEQLMQRYAAAIEPPREEPGFVERAGHVASGLASGLVAGTQRTSPVVTGLDGKPNYETLGEMKQADSGPIYIDESGQWVPVDARKHVVLNDPQSGKATVYKRSAATDEGLLPSLGRVLGVGALAPANAGFKVVPQAVPSRAQELLKDFDALEVDPTLPAVTQSRTGAIVQNTLREVPGAAGAVESRAQASVAQTGRAADRIAAGYGEAANEKQAGDVIQEAVENFAKSKRGSDLSGAETIAAPTRETSMAQKAGALYDRLGGFFGKDDQVAIGNTLEALQGPMERFPTSPELGKLITNPKLRSYFDALRPREETIDAVTSSLVDAAGNPIVKQPAQTISKGGTLTFDEVKELRSAIGRMLEPGASLVSDIPRSDLKAVFAALSRDIEGAAEAKGPAALTAFKRANNYYSAAMQRIDQIEAMLGKSPEGAYGAVLRAAQDGTRGDINKLWAIRRATPHDQWGNVAAATLRLMGKPSAGQIDPLAEMAFSPATFLTNYSKLSDSGKDVVFNSTNMRGLRLQLDRLVNVAAAQKNVAKLANSSGTARVGMAAAGTAGLMSEPVTTILGLMGGNIGARAMMNPTFVRWLYSDPKTVDLAPMVANLNRLDNLARNDAGLKPIAQYLRQSLVLAPAHADSERPTRNNN